MNPDRKKYIIAGVIALVTITGAVAYLQVRKLIKEWTLKFKKISVKRATPTSINFDLTLDFENKSSIGLTMDKQVYDVYVNDVYITTLKSNIPTPIMANGVSPLTLNVELNPVEMANKLNKNILNLIATPDKLRIKLDCKLRVKIGFIPINVPFVYEDTLKNMMAS